jgi:hypothetical protein
MSHKIQLRTLIFVLAMAVPPGVTGVAAVRAQVLSQAGTADQTETAPGFARERAVADEVLRRPEFQRQVSESWWERKKRQLFGVLVRLFSQVTRLGRAAPWLVRTLQWTFFGGAAVGLLVFLIRQMARQRLRVSLADGAMKADAWTREASDWAERAEVFANDRAWREAVHCLYWAAIVLLESRRAWRHNPTRTPREYVRLLKAGSAQQENLRDLTRIFERTWYGLRETEEREYAEARRLFEELMTPRVAVRGPVAERLREETL